MSGTPDRFRVLLTFLRVDRHCLVNDGSDFYRELVKTDEQEEKFMTNIDPVRKLLENGSSVMKVFSGLKARYDITHTENELFDVLSGDYEDQELLKNYGVSELHKTYEDFQVVEDDEAVWSHRSIDDTIDVRSCPAMDVCLLVDDFDNPIGFASKDNCCALVNNGKGFVHHFLSVGALVNGPFAGAVYAAKQTLLSELRLTDKQLPSDMFLHFGRFKFKMESSESEFENQLVHLVVAFTKEPVDFQPNQANMQAEWFTLGQLKSFYERSPDAMVPFFRVLYEQQYLHMLMTDCVIENKPNSRLIIDLNNPPPMGTFAVNDAPPDDISHEHILEEPESKHYATLPASFPEEEIFAEAPFEEAENLDRAY
ncbi:hypothetical protein BIW11_04497 [Tropilaelaps mercedesae]|uniref:Uncharacterized protein n=1 Tax=Tropilaelaps mercedesae TaxID=418985 RepID=A0A1V9X5A7_9ACAR|nr:hypothetical protein BIW11_04497 [Tropilaelaps mercedesae]